MSNVYVHFSLISFPARYSVVNFQLESHSLRFREVIVFGWNFAVILNSGLPFHCSMPAAVMGRFPFQGFILFAAVNIQHVQAQGICYYTETGKAHGCSAEHRVQLPAKQGDPDAGC